MTVADQKECQAGRQKFERVFMLDAMGNLIEEIPAGDVLTASAAVARAETQCVFLVTVTGFGPQGATGPQDWNVFIYYTPAGWNLKTWLARLAQIKAMEEPVKAPEIATSEAAKERVFSTYSFLVNGDPAIVQDKTKVTVARVGRYDSAAMLRKPRGSAGEHKAVWDRIFLLDAQGALLTEVPLERSRSKDEGPSVGDVLSYLEEPQQLAYIVMSDETYEDGRLTEQQIHLEWCAGNFSVAAWWARQCEMSASYVSVRLTESRDPEARADENVPFLA